MENPGCALVIWKGQRGSPPLRNGGIVFLDLSSIGMNMMVKFSSDVDLLKWEPVLFRELALASQTLSQGADGVLSGTSFTSSGGSFITAGVSVGHVICLLSGDRSLDGCYEVVSVDSATQLTVSVVRATSEESPVAPPAGSSIVYKVSTYDPQAEAAGYSLLQFFGIGGADGSGSASVESVLNVRALRQASVFSVLAAVFASSATELNSQGGYWQKSLRYQGMFNTARLRARLEIDTDSDAIAEEFQTGGMMRLRRV